MKTTCGTLIINEFNEILLGHVTGQKHFDIPKGLMDENESYLNCAIRECQEETGINLNPIKMEDIGLFDYNNTKKLYVFNYHVNKNDINMKELTCKSLFEHFKTKKMLPEVDGFYWFSINEAKLKTAKSMKNVLDIIFNENKNEIQKNLFKNI